MGRLLTLNSAGKLALRGPSGSEVEVRTARPNVLLLMDTSGSMQGSKFTQAKSGAEDFTRSAIGKGYSTALAIFADRAAMVCDPTSDVAHFTSKLARLSLGIVGHSTDLAAGLILAAKFPSLAATVIVTDGQTSQSPALKAATILKDRGTQIICIGTDDADRAFLEKLATSANLATHVSAGSLRSAIGDASRLLIG